MASEISSFCPPGVSPQSHPCSDTGWWDGSGRTPTCFEHVSTQQNFLLKPENRRRTMARGFPALLPSADKKNPFPTREYKGKLKLEISLVLLPRFTTAICLTELTVLSCYCWLKTRQTPSDEPSENGAETRKELWEWTVTCWRPTASPPGHVINPVSSQSPGVGTALEGGCTSTHSTILLNSLALNVLQTEVEKTLGIINSYITYISLTFSSIISQSFTRLCYFIS